MDSEGEQGGILKDSVSSFDAALHLFFLVCDSYLCYGFVLYVSESSDVSGTCVYKDLRFWCCGPEHEPTSV